MLALGVPMYFAIGLTLVLFVVDCFIRQRGERKADKVLDGWRVKDEDFETYAEAERQTAQFLADLDRKD